MELVSRQVPFSLVPRVDILGPKKVEFKDPDLNLYISADPPMITSIFQTVRVISSSSPSTLMIPLGYTGTVVTCTALGWPTPAIGWVKSIGNFTKHRMASDSTQDTNFAFVSARLKWLDGFQESDAGDYTCVVQASDTNAISSEVLTLSTTTPASTSVMCPLGSQEANFQVRVLYTDCLTWGENQKMDIARVFVSEVVNIVNAACDNVTVRNIVVASPPTCSQQVMRAAIFRGTISTESASRTQEIFCVLSLWKQSGPLVRINSNFHLVDEGCTLGLRSLDDVECVLGLSGSSSFPLVPVVAAAGILSCYHLAVECDCTDHAFEALRLRNMEASQTAKW